MDYTTNLNLKKPEYSDAADIVDINGNMDIIDGILGELIPTDEYEWIEQDIEVTDGKYAKVNGTAGADGGLNSFINGHISQMISVEEGEHIKVRGRAQENMPVCVFYSANEILARNFVGSTELVTENTPYTDYEITIPNNVHYIIVQTNNTTWYPIKVKKYTNIKIANIKDELDKKADLTLATDNEYEIKQLDRRILKAEKNNDFAWSSFDKPYFVFIHDDMNSHYTGFANLFHSLNVPLGAATIVQSLDENKIATMRQMVADGGEVLAHYDSSPTESSTDAEWLSITRDVKKALESYGFDVRGIIIANSTQGSTNKGEKYCRRYFDYANDHMGKSTQYNLPRRLMLNYSDYDSFKSDITSRLSQNGIHAFGFHGGRADESWITNENLTDIINYIRNNGGEITTYSRLFDEFGTTVLEKRLAALENA